jgi:large subunit ribosomal protein L54
MICRTCLRAARPSLPLVRTPRFLSTTPSLRNATPISAATATQTNARPADAAPAATSTSAAQPFSAPLTPSPDPAIAKAAAAAAQKKAAPLVKSSVAAGTPLKGLNFVKNAQDPVALADEEYPEWLWTILSRQEKSADAGGMGDLFCKLLC